MTSHLVALGTRVRTQVGGTAPDASGLTQCSELNPNVNRDALFMEVRVTAVSVRSISSDRKSSDAVTTLVVCDKSGDAKVSIFHDESTSLPFRRGCVIKVKLANASIRPRNKRYNFTLADYEVSLKKIHLDAVQLKAGDYPWLPVHRYRCAAAASSRGKWSTLLRCGPPLVLQVCAHQVVAEHAGRLSGTPSGPCGLGQQGIHCQH